MSWREEGQTQGSFPKKYGTTEDHSRSERVLASENVKLSTGWSEMERYNSSRE